MDVEGKSNSEPLTTTIASIVLSREKKGPPVTSNDDCPRRVHFPFVDWDEETRRGGRGVAQRKARKSSKRVGAKPNCYYK
jgi:hypothetical protein